MEMTRETVKAILGEETKVAVCRTSGKVVGARTSAKVYSVEELEALHFEAKEEATSPKTVITYRSASDKLGRCSFTLDWVCDDGTKKGQCFFSDPRKYGHKRPEEVAIEM